MTRLPALAGAISRSAKPARALSAAGLSFLKSRPAARGVNLRSLSKSHGSKGGSGGSDGGGQGFGAGIWLSIPLAGGAFLGLAQVRPSIVPCIAAAVVSHQVSP
jgi:hypothetical protein